MYKEKQSIFCILVTYNPDFSQLEKTLNSLFTQVDKVVIVKNSPEQFSFADSFPDKIHIIQLEKNMGIAYAQNRGIEYALSHCADFVLLSDQDTIYPENYVVQMLTIAENEKLSKIGALTPIFFDEVKCQYSPIMIGKTRAITPKKGKIYKITHSISSGTLVPVEVIKKCGGMLQEFFIDFVDFEWCWRVMNQDYNIYCISGVEIHHILGDKLEKRFGIKIVSRSLFRFYYIIRNGYYLLTTDYLKKRERKIFRLLMWKKIFEALMLYHFSSLAFFIVRSNFEF